MRKTWIIVAAGVVLSCVCWLSWEGRANADTPVIQNATGMKPALAGLYYTREFPGAAGPVHVFWNIMADGNLVATSDVERWEAGPSGLTTGTNHGTWVRTGPRSIATTALFFVYDPTQAHAHVQYLKIKAEFEFSLDYQNVTVYQANTLYGADQDPLDPNEVPVFGPIDIPVYTGRRVNVELTE